MADTALARLERLLYILPAAARSDGAAFAELAQALGVAEKTVLRDLQEAIDRDAYLTAGNPEPFTILLENTRVRVHAPHEFKRPTRLNAREALALAVGLRTMAAEAEPTERERILALASRLEQDLRVPSYPLRPLTAGEVDSVACEMSVGNAGDWHQGIEIEFNDDEVRGRILHAIEQGLLCLLTYVKSGAPGPELRRVKPQWLLYSNGQWYLAGYDYDRRAGRTFRIDRVLKIESEPGDPNTAVVEAQLPSGGYAFVGDDGSDSVRVRYSARVARWVAERTGSQLDADGSITLTLDVADANWIVRHVLQYGADAEVLEPAWVRRLVHDAAEKLAG